MGQSLKKLLKLFDDKIIRHIVKSIYPKYFRPRFGYLYNFQVLCRYAFAQKILKINSSVKWPVDFRSKVIGVEGIDKGILCDPGDSMGVYINGSGGIKFGNNVEIGPNTIITSVNHSIHNLQEYPKKKGIVIGNNVWIGANCSILAGAKIGNNVTIGAGCVVSVEVPGNTIVLSESRSLKIIPKKSEINIEDYGELN